MSRRFDHFLCHKCEETAETKSHLETKLQSLVTETDKIYERWKYYAEPPTEDQFWSLKERIKSLTRGVRG